MNHDDLKALLSGLKAGDVPLDDALEALSKPPLEDIGYAVIDHQRGLRNGVPEVIYGEGKTQEQLIGIAGRLLERGSDLLVTRIGPEAGQLLCDTFPGVIYHPISRLAYKVTEGKPLRGKGTIAVLCAGTSDLPVAEEAAITAEVLGNKVQRIFDVGVAGLHRLLERIDEIRQARVVIVVAGMEGALPSVVGGLVMSPVIAVPTSVGYGANFQGLAALLGMLNSCASGITVVNIDNGFGAAFSASLINGL